MITKLSIKNYALIDDVSVDFESGFTTITGETGAGKSILLGALSLLLGKRADLTSVKDISKKCILEAEFTLEEKLFSSTFNSYDLDFDKHTIIRRELLPSGKSRAFVNDTPVNLSQLQNIAPYLADIHNQHDTLSLFSETYQMEVLDVLAGNSDSLKVYKKKLKEYHFLSETIAELKYKKESDTKELDYNTFLYNELEASNLSNINQEELEEAYETLNNSELIRESLSFANEILSKDQLGSIDTLKEARVSLNKLISFSNTYENLWNRLDSVIIELEDVLEEIEQIGDKVDADPSKLMEINEVLQNLYKLQQKHNLQTVEELLELQDKLSLKIETTNSIDLQIEKLEIKQKDSYNQVLSLGEEIHNNRKIAIPILINKTIPLLNKLGLQNAQLKIELNKSKTLKNNGLNNIDLLFTANKGLPFGPLKKIASGGELSRIMLSIKAILAQYKQMPTLIFDEIDTGLSGEVANKMAEILHNMGSTMQILCITHLPQIAASGKNQIKIFKEDIEELTSTKLIVLDKEERIRELAEMIGGNQLSEAAINHAKELLN